MPLHAPSTPAPAPGPTATPAATTSGRHRARHAAPGPVLTPWTGLVEAVTARAAGVARRSAVVAASTGLVMTMGVSASSAEPLVEQPRPLPAPTAPAAAAPEPAVTEALVVAADVPVTFARSAAPGVSAPPPPPPPPPAPVVEEVADEATSEEATSDDEDAAEAGSEDVEEASTEREEAPAVSRSGERGSSQESSGSAEESSEDEEPAEEAAPQEEGSDEGGSAASSAGSSVLDIAAQYVGTPYVYGGTTPSGFDCSGFTSYVFAQAGISLPRTAAAQGAGGTRVSRSEARPGDLAVVSDGSHVGIYAGGNQWYDSPRPGKSVSLRDMWTSDVYFVRY